MLDDNHVVIYGIQRGLYVVVTATEHAIEISCGHPNAPSVRFVQDFQCLLKATLLITEQVKEYPTRQFHLGCLRVALIERGAAVNAATFKGKPQAVEWWYLTPIVGVQQAMVQEPEICTTDVLNAVIQGVREHHPVGVHFLRDGHRVTETRITAKFSVDARTKSSWSA